MACRSRSVTNAEVQMHSATASELEQKKGAETERATTPYYSLIHTDQLPW